MNPDISQKILLLLALATAAAQLQASHQDPIEEVTVHGRQDTADFPVTQSTIEASELVHINLTSIEDAVSYEPSLIVRKRYIGDANGTLGLRGANMFQTTRSLIFADGLPLHYHLQTQYSGSPRWALVAADEVESVSVLYGPFSAEYSGNAMGGIVNIKTLQPQESGFTLKSTIFEQQYDELATDEDYRGDHVFISYGNRLGDLSLYTFYNRVSNDSQPMSLFAADAAPASGGEIASRGGIEGASNQGNPVLYYGDSGPEHSTSELAKIKLAYTLDTALIQGTVAYEDRLREQDTLNNFLRDSNGQAIWEGNITQNGQRYRINRGNFQEREQQRRSLLLGLALDSRLNENWQLSVNASEYRLLEDEELRSERNPQDPAYTPSGRVTDFNDTGWTTADIKLTADKFGQDENFTLSYGLHLDRYELNLFAYDSPDYHQGAKGTLRTSSGGQTRTDAAFVQGAWAFTPDWELALGARYEHWQSREGYFGNAANVQLFTNRSKETLSPKLALSYQISDWLLRYSAARAFRFPIVEELYQNNNTAAAVQVANAGLAPEDGLHQNILIERQFGNGSTSLNLFQEKVRDTIFNQSGIIEGQQLNTFLSVDEVQTRGAEFSYIQQHILQSSWSLRFNVSYVKSTVEKNHPNPSVEGNDFPRLPRWRANLLSSWQITPSLDLGLGLRYASNSFANLDNSDRQARVFGAMDSYTFLNAKLGWQYNDHLRVALGIDNISNETAYVHHPWPSRTSFIEMALSY